MQVVFNAVYERAKATEKKVVFVIDEAHYLMADATSLGFLETAVRHSRHYDISLQFVTQTGGEFTLTPEAKTIADLCSIVQIHRVAEEAEKLATWFGLSERETNWVRTAKAGNEEDGYSEALLGIDEEGWFPFGFGRVSMRRRWLTGKRRQLSMDLLSSLPRWWILNRLTHRTEIWWRATMIEVDAIPDELTSVPQWVCWTERERGGKQTKIPVMPGTASFASVQDPETWASFDAAVETAADDDPVAGIGFVFTEDDPFVGVDLDDCRNAETGEADSWAHEIIEQLDSFTEVSPSGTGYHVYVRGELPDGGNRSGDIECYESARFFTVTGDRVPGTPHDINERTAELADLHAEYIAPSTTSVKGDSSMTASVTPPSMDDEDLLEKAMQAKNGPKFTRLWNGETGGYDSHSETDMALACLLAFWTQKDASQMDRLFRQSRLYREKWDEPHYSGGKTYGEGRSNGQFR